MTPTPVNGEPMGFRSQASNMRKFAYFTSTMNDAGFGMDHRLMWNRMNQIEQQRALQEQRILRDTPEMKSKVRGCGVGDGVWLPSSDSVDRIVSHVVDKFWAFVRSEWGLEQWNHAGLHAGVDPSQRWICWSSRAHDCKCRLPIRRVVFGRFSVRTAL